MWDAAMNEKIRAALIAQTQWYARSDDAGEDDVKFDKREYVREMERIRSKADALVAQIEESSIHIEVTHDLRFGPHALQIDLQALQEIVGRIVETATRESADMKAARRIAPVRFAVQAWLYTEVIVFGRGRPSLYDDGPDVAEIRDLLVEALGEDGAPQESAVRKALADDLESFDPFYLPEHIKWFVDWARDEV